MTESFIYLGIDFGMKNIGLSVGQSITKTASALRNIKYNNPMNWGDFDKIIQQWEPNKIIIGWPLTEDGRVQKINNAIKTFSKEIAARYHLEVIFADERYSSMQAQSEFADARSIGVAKKKNSKNMDSYAAKHILQRWMDSNL